MGERGRRGAAWLRAVLAACVLGLSLSACSSAAKATPPRQITIGTLYASVGAYAAASTAQLDGLKFWVSQVNAKGGVFVKPFGRRLHVRLIALDDQSSPSAVQSLADQLIQQDHVNILVSDFGSVLTSEIVPLAQENGVLLFDPTATAPGFFTESIFGNGDPDIVMTSLPSSALWPRVVAHYLLARHFARIGIIYGANDFTEAQATTVDNILGAASVIPAVYQSVPTSTTDYLPYLRAMAKEGVQAVVEFGYASNDLSFLGQLHASGLHFPFVFTAWPGQELATFVRSIGPAALNGIFTYLGPPLRQSRATFGLDTAQFLAAFGATDRQPVNAIDVAGYVAGLVIQGTLARTKGLGEQSLRVAAHALSGHMMTLAGPFALDQAGQQVGEMMPLAELHVVGHHITYIVMRGGITQ